MSKPREIKRRLHTEKSAVGTNNSKKPHLLDYVGDAAVDIIAVHGLASSYEWSWSYQLDDTARYSWLRERLGADIPDAQILGYEYPSEWYGDPAYTNLEECGAELLRCIIRSRCHLGRPDMCGTRRNRPIVFIAHSFGGLVVKQALVIAYQKWQEGQEYDDNSKSPVKEWVRRAQMANYRDFLSSVGGIIFLGTPHRGSSFSNWANIKMAMGSWKGTATHPELVKLLKLGSQPLKDLDESFKQACQNSDILDICLRCFRETRKILLPPHIVVPAESAFLNDDGNESLDANHMQMNKFPPGKDANYDKILSAILETLVETSQSVLRGPSRRLNGFQLSEGLWILMESWLNPSKEPQAMQYKSKLDCQKAASYTCQWLYGHESFARWKSGQRNVLWIHGKPGSGKSVLASSTISTLSVVDNASFGFRYWPCKESLEKHSCDFKVVKPTILYYFGGVDRDHDNPKRILSTLIHQLLKIHDMDEVLFGRAYSATKVHSDECDANKMFQLLENLISTLARKIFIVVDALDEIVEGPEVLKLLLTLAASTRTKDNIRLLFSSQRRQPLQTQFDDYTDHYELCLTDYSYPDISQYIEENTREMIQRRPELAVKEEAIIDRLKLDAQGMFELVNNTIKHLEGNVARVEDVDQELANLPTDLSSVYDKVFKRMTEKRDRVREALQILSVARTPLNAEDLQCFLEISRQLWARRTTISDVDPIYKRVSSSKESAASRIRGLLDTLVDIDAKHTVTLVHPSLRRTLLIDPSPKSTPNPEWYQFSEDKAHLTTAMICMAVCSDSTQTIAVASFDLEVPTIEYAWKHWAHHLRASTAKLSDRDSVQCNLYDRMVRHVHRDTISYLQKLAKFVTKPIEPVTGVYSIMEYRQSWQRAQNALTGTLTAVCDAREQVPVAVELQTAQDRIPRVLSDIRSDKTYPMLEQWMKSNYSWMRNWLLQDNTSIERVKLDNLLEGTALERLSLTPGVTVILLDAVRALRLLTLRLAVNPIHAALIQDSDNPSLKSLVYVSQLIEDAASFPFWKHIPETEDPRQPFFCGPQDPESAAAKFVLLSLGSARAGATPTNQPQNSERPTSNATTSQSIKDLRRLRQLQEIDGERWMMARLGVGLFDSEGWFQTLIANPLMNLEIKEKLFFLSKNAPQPTFMHPAATLDAHAPTTVRETPVAEVVKAIPAYLKWIYIRYISLLLEVLAGIPRAGIVAHFIQVNTSKDELYACGKYFLGLVSKPSKLATSGSKLYVYWTYIKGLTSESTRQSLRHIPFAVLFLVLRSVLCPSIGAHPLAHPWVDLRKAYRHPAAYLNVLAFHNATFWLKQTFLIRMSHAIGGIFIRYSADRSNPALIVSDALVATHHLVTAGRNLFGIAFTTAVLVASASVILYDHGNVAKLGYFTFWYCVSNSFTLFSLLAGAVLQQHEAGFLPGLLVITLEFACLTALIFYEDLALRILYWVFFPFIWPAMKFWSTVLIFYPIFVRWCGIVGLILTVLLAIWWTQNIISDPHNMNGSIDALRKAIKKAKSSQDQEEKVSISTAPLGSDRSTEKASTRLVPNATVEDALEDDTAWDEWDEEPHQEPEVAAPDAHIGHSQHDTTDQVSEETQNAQSATDVTENAIYKGITSLMKATIDSFITTFEKPLQLLLNLNLSNYPRLSSHISGNFLGLPLRYYSTSSVTSSSSSYSYSSSSFGPFRTSSYSGPGSHGGGPAIHPFDRSGLDDFGFRYSDGMGTYHEKTTTYFNSGLGSVRDESSEGDSNEWRMGGEFPGEPLGNKTYNRTVHGNMSDWERIWFGILFFLTVCFTLFWIGYGVWGWWKGWVTIEAADFSDESVMAKCWHFGTNIGPVYVGYGCKGFFWEVPAYSAITGIF